METKQAPWLIVSKKAAPAPFCGLLVSLRGHAFISEVKEEGFGRQRSKVLVRPSMVDPRMPPTRVFGSIPNDEYLQISLTGLVYAVWFPTR